MTDELMTLPVDDVDRMLTISEDMAERNLDTYINDNSIPIGKRNARLMHESCVILGKLGNSAGTAFRKQVSAMYTTGEWKELELDYPDDPTQKIHFEFFSDWLQYATKEAGISSSAASALNIFVENVVDPVAKRLVVHSDGNPFEVDEVLSLKEGHTQRVAYAAKNILKTNPEDYKGVADMLEFAQDPATTFEDLQENMKQRGMQQQRVPASQCNVYHVSDDVTIYTIVMETPAQQTKIDAGLRNRVEYRERYSNDMVKFWDGLESAGEYGFGDDGNIDNTDSDDNASSVSHDSPSDDIEGTTDKAVNFRDFSNYLKDQA